jgi:hypothetical protein
MRPAYALPAVCDPPRAAWVLGLPLRAALSLRTPKLHRIFFLLLF